MPSIRLWNSARLLTGGACAQAPCGAGRAEVRVAAGVRTVSALTGVKRFPTAPQNKWLSSALSARGMSSVSKFVGQCADVADTRRREALSAYRCSREETDRALDLLLKENKLVLFLDGTVDAPRSQFSHNVVKMLTQVQAIPLLTVDVGAHAAIEGYAIEKSGHPEKARCPLLFKDGAVLGGHDELLQLFTSNQLQGSIGCTSTRSTNKHYKGELPVALY